MRAVCGVCSDPMCHNQTVSYRSLTNHFCHNKTLLELKVYGRASVGVATKCSVSLLQYVRTTRMAPEPVLDDSSWCNRILYNWTNRKMPSELEVARPIKCLHCTAYAHKVQSCIGPIFWPLQNYILGILQQHLSSEVWNFGLYKLITLFQVFAPPIGGQKLLLLFCQNRYAQTPFLIGLELNQKKV